MRFCRYLTSISAYGREMGFEYSDGKLVLHIDRLDLYEMFDIQI